jgi:hypothetical protein
VSSQRVAGSTDLVTAKSSIMGHGNRYYHGWDHASDMEALRNMTFWLQDGSIRAAN